jgi:hypothetical protein
LGILLVTSVAEFPGRHDTQGFYMTLQELRERAKAINGELTKLNDTIAERRSTGKSGVDLWSADDQKKYDTLTAELATLTGNIEAEERAEGLQAHLARSAEQRGQAQRNGRTDPRLSDEIPGTNLDYGDRFSDRDAARQSSRQEERRCLALHAWACESRAANQITDAHRSGTPRVNTLLPNDFRATTYAGHVRLVSCSRDPIGYEGSPRHLYLYVACHPLSVQQSGQRE